jgi:hypothetical protein
MKTIYRNIIFVFLFTLIFQSCIEEVIDVEIPSSITGQNFPQTEGDLRAILTALYGGVRNEFNTLTFGEDRGDSFDVGLIGSVSDSWAQNLNGGNGLNWSNFYNLLNNVNLVISSSQEIQFGSDRNEGQILGEAYFIRALIYFQMVKIWGDIPLLLEPVNQNTDPVARTPVAQVMSQIFTDIDAAISNIPENGFQTKYTASKPAAYALLADAKMWNGKVLNGGESDFQAAVAAINNIQGVSLLDTYADIFDTKANDEVIFSIFFDFNEQSGMYANRVTSRDINVDPILNPDVPTSTSFNARADYRPSDIVINLFEPEDIRAARSFIPILVEDGDDPDSDPDILSFSQNKFKGTNNNNDTFYDNDIIIYRWADMLLLRAEANAALNQIPLALQDLNLVRDRAGLDPYTGPMNKIDIEQEILDERGRELFLELKRYWDLVRYDAGGTIDIYNQVPNLNGLSIPLLWPVNDNLISENELITQTSGY